MLRTEIKTALEYRYRCEFFKKHLKRFLLEGAFAWAVIVVVLLLCNDLVAIWKSLNLIKALKTQSKKKFKSFAALFY